MASISKEDNTIYYLVEMSDQEKNNLEINPFKLALYSNQFCQIIIHFCIQKKDDRFFDDIKSMKIVD